MDFKSKIVLISGPTASGKSSFAIQLAKKINGEIINADSMQIYKQLRIISARPDPKKYQKIKNHNNSKNVVIGFGITEKTIKSLKKADGLVVGSAICKEITKSIKNRQNTVTNVTNIVKRLRNKIQ